MTCTVCVLAPGARRHRIRPGHHIDRECFIKEADVFTDCKLATVSDLSFVVTFINPGNRQRFTVNRHAEQPPCRRDGQRPAPSGAVSGEIHRDSLLVGTTDLLRRGVVFQRRLPRAEVLHLQIPLARMVRELATINHLCRTGLTGIADNAVRPGFGVLCRLNKGGIR